jgi:hypothetical protein
MRIPFTDRKRSLTRRTFKGASYGAANWLALGRTTGRGKNAPSKKTDTPGQGSVSAAVGGPVSRVTKSVMKMRSRIEVNLEELDQIIDHGKQAPLSEAECQKLRSALRAMADRLSSNRSTEKTSVCAQPVTSSRCGAEDSECAISPGRAWASRRHRSPSARQIGYS